MPHEDKELTRAVSHLLQEDLKKMCDQRWEVIDGGLVPPVRGIPPVRGMKSVPRAIIYFRQINYIPPINLVVMRHRYSGGEFFVLGLTIDDELNSAHEHLMKYDGHAHVKCLIRRGVSWDNRFSFSNTCTVVCNGVYGMIDTPDFSEHYAKKLVDTIDAHIKSGIHVEAH